MAIMETLQVASTVISVVKPIIEKVLPKIQESMKGFADRMMEISDKYPSISEFAQIIDKAADVLGDVLYVLGINADTAGVIGAKVDQAEKGIDEFNSIEEYIKYLREEIILDKEKFDSLSEEEKVAYTIVGMCVEAGAIGEKLGIEIPADVVEMIGKISEIGKIALDTKEIISIITKIKEEGITNLSDICEYFYGIGDSDRLKTGEILAKTIEIFRPNESKRVINEIKNEVRNDAI